jgi:hypothetical protein
MMWGRNKENGVWISQTSDWRFMFRNHDALYIAAGRLRFRLMRCADRMIKPRGGAASPSN